MENEEADWQKQSQNSQLMILTSGGADDWNGLNDWNDWNCRFTLPVCFRR